VPEQPHGEETFMAIDAQLPPIESYVQTIHAPTEGGGSLSILTAGCRSEPQFGAYAQAVQDFRWSAFYDVFEGELFFDWLRWRLLRPELADVVLIDSRTGISEMSGPATRQLADVVVSLCAPNHANLNGVIAMSDSFVQPAVLEARGRAPEIMIVPSRVDNSETQARNQFEKRFRDEVDRFTPAALRTESRALWDLRIPYIPKYAYEEDLTVGVPDRAEDLEAAYNRLALALLSLAPSGSRLAAERERMLRPADAVPEAEVRRPSIWHMPVSRNPLFVGRGEELERLSARLAEAGSKVVLSGLAGVGKTELAGEFVHRFGSSYAAVWWVDARDETSIGGGLFNLAQAAGIPTGEDGVLSAVVRWLAGHKGWLLVLDDAQVATASSLLRGVQTGHVLITSRDPRWAPLAVPVEVGSLPPHHGAEILLGRTGQSDAEAAAEVSTAVGGLPLALTLVADYVASSGRDLRTMVHVLDEQYGRVFQRESARLEAVFARSLEDLSVEARELLGLAASLARAPVPLDLLTAPGPTPGDTLSQILADPIRLDDAVIELRGHSLLQSQGDDVVVHPMLGSFLRHGTVSHAVSESPHVVLSVMDRSFPADPGAPSAWPACARLAPHVGAAGDGPWNHREDAVIAVSLQARAGAFHGLWGNVAEGMKLLDRAERTASDAGIESDDETLLARLHRLAAYLVTGALDEAQAAAAQLGHGPHTNGADVVGAAAFSLDVVAWLAADRRADVLLPPPVVKPTEILERILVARETLGGQVATSESLNRDLTRTPWATRERDRGVLARSELLGARDAAVARPEAAATIVSRVVNNVRIARVHPLYATTILSRCAAILLEAGNAGQAQEVTARAREDLLRQHGEHPKQLPAILQFARSALGTDSSADARRMLEEARWSASLDDPNAALIDEALLALDIKEEARLAEVAETSLAFAEAYDALVNVLFAVGAKLANWRPSQSLPNA
jgi:hypothetical protein